MKALFPVILLGLLCPAFLQAQAWSREDSIWLSGILSGKDSLRLNTETMRAIRSGSLINTSPVPAGTMQGESTQLPLLLDFSEYVKAESDTAHRIVALKDLPPAVFWLYGRDLDPYDALRYSAFNRDRQANSMVLPEANGTSFALAPALAFAFSKTYRQKVKNRKHALAWNGGYDQMPSTTMVAKQRAYREAHPEKVLPAGEKYSTSQRREEPLPLPDIPSKKKKPSYPAEDSILKRDTLRLDSLRTLPFRRK